MKYRQSFCTMALAYILGGCATFDKIPDDPIPVTQFVNSLKCEYAQFLTNYHGKRLDMRGWVVTGSMELNVLSTTTFGGGVESSGIVPYQGVSIGFGVSGEVTKKWTTATTINFVLESKAENANICRGAKAIYVDGTLGYGDWLIGLANSLEAAQGGDPKFGISELNYSLIFAIERKTDVNGNVGLSIVPLKVSAKALAARNDLQTIKIKMAPPDKVVGTGPDGKPITKRDVKPFFVPINPNTLSPMLLAPNS